MIDIYWPAVRAYKRLAAPLVEASDFAADADAGFDSGEWSRPLHDRALHDDLACLSARVALAFDLDPDRFESMCFAARHIEDELFLRSAMRSTN